MSYALFIDSTCDLSLEMYAEMKANMIPMHFVLGGREIIDDLKMIGCHEFYEELRRGTPVSTMQITVFTYIEAFEKELKKGNDVIYLGFASSCSGSFDNACMAERELQEKYPDRRIKVYDSKSQCGGEGLLAYLACKYRDDGAGFDDMCRWIEENRERNCHYFTVADLNHVRRSGRMSGAAAIMGTIINIKPVMYTNPDGVLSVGAKVRGRRQALDMLAEKVKAKIVEPEGQLLLINHADAPDEAEYLAEEIRKRVTVKEIRIMPLGPVIGAHVGSGCMAVFFMGDNKNWK